MPSSVAVVRTKVCDYEELMRMIVTCFRGNTPDHPPFETCYPDLYSPDEEDMACNFVIRENGRIVSCAGVFPMMLDLCGQKVEIGGIGGVCTLPEYRGRNFMQALIDRIQQEMTAKKYPFGWLAGDRRRYSPWGYEHIVRLCKYDLSTRGPGLEKYRGKLPGKISEGSVDDLNWETIWKQAKNNPALAACGKDKLRLKYKRIHQKVLLVDGDEGGHVLMFDRQGDRAVRGCAGNPQTVGAILAEKLAADRSKITAEVPWYPDLFSPVFKDLMTWSHVAYQGSFAVMDLAQTFKIFLPHFNRRISGLGLKGTAKIKMGPARELPAQELILEADGKQLSIQSGPGLSVSGPTVDLTCHQTAELLFSPQDMDWFGRLASPAQWLAALMPVPVWIPTIYTV